jgi:hypothetical protein
MTSTKSRSPLLVLPLVLAMAGCAAPALQEEEAPASDVGAPGGLTANQRASNAILAINASQYGVGYPETFVLLQNRKGLRIEYCVDRSRLQVWISPKAGVSMDVRDKNWSNRDDHTAVFDRILLPGLNLAEFERADYDPFHSVLYFKSQTLHLAHVYDQPAVLIWLERDGNVDLKTANTDEALAREPREFVIGHTDRGRDFEWAAVLGSGEGSFRHQLVLDEGRSIYTRAEMAAGQLLVLGAGLREETVVEMARGVASRPADSTLAANEAAIAKDLEYGRFTLRGRAEMQKLLEKNRRVALSMQDFNGFMRSTNQYIYYLLWYRDGGMNTGHLTMTGWTDPARQHVPFAIQNPNVALSEPEGRFYGQVAGGPLTKWEEDGLFFVVWPAYLYWTQTGDRSFLEGRYLALIEEGLDWLERRAWDEEKGLFGRYFYVETPMKGSRDYGWDNVTGAPTDYYEGLYEGEAVTRGYDLYINALNHSVYVMLAAATGGEKAAAYLDRAKALEEGMRHFFDLEGPLPSYGDLQLESGRIVTSAPYGMDRTDYQWALALPRFDFTSVENQQKARAQLLQDLRSDPKGNFICAWAAILTAMDTEHHDEAEIMDALDYLVPQSVRPGKYLPMAYTIPELVDVEDGQPFHDVRPLVYSIAPWLSAVTNFGLHRLPLGVAVRGTALLESIDRYRYRDSVLDVRFEGEGGLESVVLNGAPLEHTLQIPDGALAPGDNVLVVKMGAGAKAGERLSSSTVRLESVSSEGAVTRFQIEAFGQNRLTFGDLVREVSILDDAGAPVEVRTVPDGAFTHVSFEGRGVFTVILG